MAKKKWQGNKDAKVVTAAKANGALFVKRRNTYAFCGFASASQRAAFIAAVVGPGVQVEPWPYRIAGYRVARVSAL